MARDQHGVTIRPIRAGEFAKRYASIRMTPCALSAGIIAALYWAGPGEGAELRGRDYWPTHEWRIGIPQEHAVDGVRLGRACDDVPLKYPRFRSLLLIRHGRIVFERYFRAADRHSPNNVKSCSKVIISALIGAALREGHIRSLDAPLTELLPEHYARVADQQKRRITPRHLLTMSAGLEWDENDETTVRWLASEDRCRFALNLPMAAAPGTRFNYNTAQSHLLSAALTRATGMRRPGTRSNACLRRWASGCGGGKRMPPASRWEDPMCISLRATWQSWATSF
jgi:hypothetical protein